MNQLDAARILSAIKLHPDWESGIEGVYYLSNPRLGELRVKQKELMETPFWIAREQPSGFRGTMLHLIDKQKLEAFVGTPEKTRGWLR